MYGCLRCILAAQTSIFALLPSNTTTTGSCAALPADLSLGVDEHRDGVRVAAVLREEQRVEAAVRLVVHVRLVRYEGRHGLMKKPAAQVNLRPYALYLWSCLLLLAELSKSNSWIKDQGGVVRILCKF